MKQIVANNVVNIVVTVAVDTNNLKVLACMTKSLIIIEKNEKLIAPLRLREPKMTRIITELSNRRKSTCHGAVLQIFEESKTYIQCRLQFF